jgi:cytidine deaminase
MEENLREEKMNMRKTGHEKFEFVVEYRKKACEVNHGECADCRKWMSELVKKAEGAAVEG